MFRVCRPVWRARSLPEQIVCETALPGCAVDLLPASCRFRLQQRDPALQFFEREAFKILPRQLGQRIIRVFRENLVEVHVQIVDRWAGDVNKVQYGVQSGGSGAAE